MTFRTSERIVKAQTTREGAGFLVHRSFPTPELEMIDPFLLLDEMGPSDLGPGEARGAPDHPHRGFETVTYMISGEMVHEDSAGNSGRIGPGDVQWMTAGSGVIHSELPGEAILRDGGRMHGFQLWVNLPRRDKMMAPRYQEVPSDRIPTASREGATVRVIAGEALGVSAVIDTRTPILHMHWTLEPGARIEQPVPASFNLFAYVFEGEVDLDDERHPGRGDAIVFARDGEAIRLTSSGDRAADFLLIGGEPLREPVARYGPFVMNTRAEIIEAVEDYQSGRFVRSGSQDSSR